MVRISKANRAPMEVTEGAYENFYKNAGWRATKSVSHSSVTTDGSDDEWENAMEEAEKPLSEMNVEELRAKAASLGIDLAGVNSPKQIRDRIRKYIS